jgi:DNA-directed RNA polymerase subunit RPC12/RpoP
VICKLCNYETANIVSARGHVNAKHLQIKAYLCLVCKQQIATESGLRIHSMNHLEGKFQNNGEFMKYSCPKCNKKLKTNNAVDKHIKWVHNKERPIPCTKCPFRAQDQHRLGRHEKLVHADRVRTQCFLCSCSYAEGGEVPEAAHALKASGTQV